MKRYYFKNRLFFLIGLLGLVGCSDSGNIIDEARTWMTYQSDPASSNYTPLDQINPSNVGELQNVWTFLNY